MQHKSEHKNFRSLQSWKKSAQNAGLQFKKVSVSKDGEYWQIYQEGTIVGYFVTGSKSGHILREVLDA